MGDSPEQAAHYHLGFKSGGLYLTWHFVCVHSDDLFQILFWYAETAEILIIIQYIQTAYIS